MAATRVISLAVCPWTVRAVDIESVGLPSGTRYDTAEFRSDLARGVPGRVPGCVHHALIGAGLIESPDHADAEERLQWIGRTEWEYCCTFDWAETPHASSSPSAGGADHLELVLDGLDTVAEVSLNGQTVGRAESFFFPHRFGVDQAIRAGRNELSIRFVPPLLHVRAEQDRLGTRPFNGDQIGWDPFVFIRKPACNLGWDWGPKVATVGIAGEGTIEKWSGARIEHVRPLVLRADAEHAEICVYVDAVVDAGCSGPLRAAITLHDPHGRGIVARGDCVLTGGAAPRATGAAVLTVTEPSLWWPRGYGPQSAAEERPRYGVRVRLTGGDAALDEWHGRIGLRMVTLETSPDGWGSAFTLRVNGAPVFCQGANWIPEGLFAGYAGEEVIRERIRDAAEMNANMFRVWGGGLYEPKCFYDECDRRGMLVWQDFMFSCGTYPEEAPYGGESGLIAREARHQIARLSAHPSVALWCGGNENFWGHEKWGWKERLKTGQTWGRGFWLDLLPRLCREIDPTRPYWPNSPWSGVDGHGVQRDVLDADHGDRHTWEVDAWKEGFRAPTSGGAVRFCSEFGQQSPSNLQTLLEQIDAEFGAGFLRELSRRQRGPGGDERWYNALMVAVLGSQSAARLLANASESEAGFRSWLECVQELQARTVGRGIEWHRVNRPRCGGVLFWQLNDCWAGHSWSAIDAAGRRKPLWSTARRAMSPRLLSIHAVEGSQRLFAVNDTDKPWEGEVVARRIQGRDTVVSEWRSHAYIGARTAGELTDLSARLGRAMDSDSGLFVAEAQGFEGAVASSVKSY